MARKYAVELVDIFIPAFGAVFPAHTGDEFCQVRLGRRLSCTLAKDHAGAHIAHTADARPVRLMGTPRELLGLLGDVEDVQPVTRKTPVRRQSRGVGRGGVRPRR